MTDVAKMQIVVDLKDKASKQLDGVNKKFGSVSKGAAGLVVGLGAVAGAAALGGIAVAATASINAFRGFEEAMAGVAKTTGLSGKALEEIADGVKDLSKVIPMAHEGLADIAAIAGQLGIEGKEDILGFTKTVAEVATAFDMTAEESAIAMGKLANIYEIPITETSNFASAINVLGNTTAAFEREIVNFTMNLGASAKGMGFNSTEAIAMGASMIAMGNDASDSGTRLSAAFVEMGKKVDKFSEFLGMSEESFKAAFGDDPMTMLITIIEQIEAIEDPLDRSTKRAELFGAIGGKAMKALGGDLDGLKTNLDNAATGFEENTSLSEEFAAKTGTLNASFQLLKNSVTGVAIGIGEKLAPFVSKLVKSFINIIPKVEAFATQLIDRMGPGLEGFKEGLIALYDNFIKLVDNLSESELAMGSLSFALDALVGVFNFVGKSFSTFMNLFDRYTDLCVKIDEKTSGAWDSITNIITIAIDIIVGAFEKITGFDLGTLWDDFKTATRESWDSITGFISDSIDVILDIIDKLLNLDLSGVWNAYWQHTEEVWGRIGAWINTAVDNVIEYIDKLIGLDLSGIWDSIKNATETVWKIISDFISNSVDTILDIINKLLDLDLSGAWSIYWQHTEEIWGKVADWINTAVDNVIGYIERLTGWDLSSVWDGIKNATETAWGIIKDSINTAIDNVIESIKKLTEWDLSGIWDGIKNATETAFDAIKAKVDGVCDAVKSKIETVWDAVQSKIETVSNTIKSKIDTVFDSIKSKVDTVSDAIKSKVDTIWDAVKSKVDTVSDAIKSKTDNVFDSIKSKIDTVADGVKSKVETVWDSVKNKVDTVSDSIKSKTETVFDAIKGKVDSVSESVKSKVDSVWDAVKSKIDSVSDSIKSKTDTAFDSIKSKINSVADDIKSKVDAKWDGIKSEIDSVSDSIKSKTDTTFDAMKSKVSNVSGDIKSKVDSAWDSIKSKIETVCGSIKSTIDKRWGDMASSVKSSLNTMKSNVDKKLGEIKNTISGWFNSVKAFFDFSKYKIKWPKITNPFSGVNFCNFVPSNMKFLFSGCGGSPPHDKSHSKSRPSDGHDQSSYDRASCSMKDYSGYDRGAIKFQRGGPITKDLNADLHEGEYVVPKKGALVMTDSKPTHVKISYNFGNVYGVNDLEKLLDKHDRKLYRQLESLI